MRQHGREPLINEPHRQWRDQAGQRLRERPAVGCRLALGPAQADGQPDDDLDDLVLVRQPGQCGQVSGPAPDRLQRRGDQPAVVTPGNADPDGSDIHAQPDALPHIAASGKITQSDSSPGAGLITDTDGWRHGLTLRHRRPLCRE
jgi:hypothetical protein